jgi:hypothetical protein
MSCYTLTLPLSQYAVYQPVLDTSDACVDRVLLGYVCPTCAAEVDEQAELSPGGCNVETVTIEGKTYALPSQQVRFKRQCEKKNIPVEWYNGRYFYHGYAARADNNQTIAEIYRATSVPLQRDDLGLGCILYPTTGASEMPS